MIVTVEKTSAAAGDGRKARQFAGIIVTVIGFIAKPGGPCLFLDFSMHACDKSA
jgi:hypothetical protein